MEYFDYGPDHLVDNFDIQEFLEDSQEKQEQRLEEELERIEEQLERREQIFEENQDELESKLDWYIERLEKQYLRNGSVDELKEKVERFYRLLRDERLKHWQDRQELERERRSLVRELDEIRSTALEDLMDL